MLSRAIPIATAASAKPGTSVLAPAISRTTDVIADRMGPENAQGMPNLHAGASPSLSTPPLPHLQNVRTPTPAPGLWMAATSALGQRPNQGNDQVDGQNTGPGPDRPPTPQQQPAVSTAPVNRTAPAPGMGNRRGA